MREKSELEKIAQGGAILFIIYTCFNYFFGCNETKPTMLEERFENKSLNLNQNELKSINEIVAGLPAPEKLGKKNDSIIKRRSDSINDKLKIIAPFPPVVNETLQGKWNLDVLQKFVDELDELDESSKAYNDSLKIIAPDK